MRKIMLSAMTLILAICAHDGTMCEDIKIPLMVEGRDTVSPMQCMMTAPALVAKYLDEHPDVKVVRWHCAIPKKEANT